MALTTKELASIVDIAAIEALGRKKAEVFRTMARDERVEDLLTEAQRLGEEHLEQMRDMVREG